MKRGLMLAVFLLVMLAAVYAATFSEVSQGDFNSGTYNNTVHNGTGVILSGSNLSGVYTSRIFDATSVARWNNLSYYFQTPTKDYLYVADDNADVWNSTDSGATWSLVKDDYTGAEANGAKASFFNSSKAYFIIYNQRIWASLNYGVTWTKINDDYNAAEGQNADAANVDKNNYIYIIEGDQDVWKSTNSGATWTKTTSNFNGGNGIVAGLVVNSSNILISVDANSDVWASSDAGTTWTLIKDDYNGVAEGNGADALAIDNNNILYILNSQQVWKSTDSGVSWIKVSNDFDTSDAHLGFSITADSNNYVYIIDGNEDVYKSVDYGSTWTKQSSNFNAGNSNARALSSILKYTNLTFQVRNCSFADCSDGIWQTLNLSNINLSGRYFQYKIDFTSQDSSITPLLFNISLDYTILDNVPPSFSSYAETPTNGSAYVQGQFYQFNVTLNETNPGNVWIEFNVVNYTSVSNISDAFSFSISDLAVGTYSYKWWANDSVGNYNTSRVRYYTITKANPTLTFLANSGTENLTLTYPQQVNITATASAGIVGLDKDETTYLSNNGLNVSLAAGSYIFRANITGNQNYSDVGYSYYNITINKASQTASLSINESSPIIYGKYINVTCNGNLYRNNNLINSEKSRSVLLGAGSYNYSCQLSESQNYSYDDDNQSFVVDKASNVLTLLSFAGWTYNYGTETTFSCFAVYETPKMYKDNVEISNTTTAVFAVGIYTIKCNISETENYTDGMSQGTLTVNKASSQTSLIFDKTSPQTYGTSITPTCSIISGQGSSTLELNGGPITSGQTLNLGGGTWNFNCSYSGNNNYTASSNYSQFVISQASTTTTLTTNPSSPITYGTASNFSCSNSQDLSILLYINGTDKSSENGLDIVRAAGTYTINCTPIGNQNYTGDSQQTTYTINKVLGNISLRLNGIESDITIDYPQPYNINATTLYGSVSIYKDGIEITGDNGLDITPTRNAALYNITAISSGDENHSPATIIRWLNVTLDVIPPEINIISPQEGSPYGYNTSLPLVFSASDEHLDSCWYNLNEGMNITLVNCENATFNASGDGSYTLYLYANDTLGNLQIKNSTFSVLVGAPTISLNSPIGIYLNTHDITFRYTPSDLDLGSCELWGNFTGVFALNQSDNAPINGAENIFILNLPDGTYKWNIRCNDSMNHSVFNGNKTFYVDTTSPEIAITEPKGTKSSWTGIPLAFTISDSSPVNCKYSVSWAIGGSVIPNTSIANCLPITSITFNLSSVGDYILSLYVSDYASNFNSSSSSFSVSTSTQPPVNPPGGGGGGGGASKPKNISVNVSFGKLEIIKIPSLIVDAGESKKIILSVKNSGTGFLNNCKLKGKGYNAEWISAEGIKGLSAGEKYDFVFTLKVPEILEAGSFKIELEVSCQETNKSTEFNAEFIEKKLTVEIIDVKRESKDKVNITYSLKELSGSVQDVEVELVLLGDNGERLATGTRKDRLEANSIKKSEIILNISEGLVGNFNLLINAISKNSSTFVQEDIVLGPPRIGGLVIAGGTSGGTIFAIILVALFIVFAIFVIRRILRLRKLSKGKKGKLWGWNIKKERFERTDLKKYKN